MPSVRRLGRMMRKGMSQLTKISRRVFTGMLCPHTLRLFTNILST